MKTETKEYILNMLSNDRVTMADNKAILNSEIDYYKDIMANSDKDYNSEISAAYYSLRHLNEQIE